MDSHKALRRPSLLTALVLTALSGCAPGNSSAARPGPSVSGSGTQQPTELASESASELTPKLALPAAPKAALAALRTASMDAPVAVFKHSPICPVSGAAEDRFYSWLKAEGIEQKVAYAHIDVLAEKPLARGLVAELNIKHESPQVLLFHKGEVLWHASHGSITGPAIMEQLGRIETID